jgi:DNA-binding NarL/FixJ family response regulator
LIFRFIAPAAEPPIPFLMRYIGNTGADVIRVVIADVPRLLTAIVRKAVEAEEDIMIVAELQSADALGDVATDAIDAIVTATKGGELAAPFRAALFGPQAIPIVAIHVDGGGIDVYGRSRTRGYGLDDLVVLLREAVAGSRPRFGC